MPNAPHHNTPRYRTTARAIRTHATNTPTTTCWRCGKTLDQHPPHADGTPATWHAGHTIDGNPHSPLAPEASVCNLTAAAHQTNQRHDQHTELW